MAAPSQTVASAIHTLFRERTTRPAGGGYAHPYASRKGKDRELNLDGQLALVRSIREALEGARGLLEGAEHRDRLARALKEVAGHQAALLPLATTLYTLPSSSSSSAHLVSLAPVQLLVALAGALGIQTYQEDSQFGLLKTSLALAGTRFVVDVDLETDAPGGADDGDADGDGQDGPAPEPAAGDEPRGKVRLSKLTVNYVGGAGEGAPARSEWLERVLRQRVEAVLEPDEAGIDALRAELSDLKVLDDAASDAEYYADLEPLAAGIQERAADGRVHEMGRHVFPTFQLYEAGPTLCTRPARPGEVLPPTEEGPVEYAVTSRWTLEVVGDMVVRGSWLGGPGTAESTTRVESLLYGAPFPYLADFVHPAGAGGRAQHWSVALSGPDGYVLSRLPFTSWATLDALVPRLRAQAVLGALFTTCFAPAHLAAVADTDADAQAEPVSLDSLLDGLEGEDGIAVSAAHGEADVRLSLMLEAREVELVVEPTEEAPYVRVTCDDVDLQDAVAAAATRGRDLVEVVRLFVQAASGA
ncbi:hypothetical protein Q5752_003080 [Cryptotrichosporon argae]